ncbi:hypothetical protein KCU65_g8537, partial [Aureobasidium melanogenum]
MADSQPKKVAPHHKFAANTSGTSSPAGPSRSPAMNSGPEASGSHERVAGASEGIFTSGAPVITDEGGEDEEILALNEDLMSFDPETLKELDSFIDVVMTEALWRPRAGELRQQMLASLSPPQEFASGEEGSNSYEIEEVIQFFGFPQPKLIQMLRLMNITRVPKIQARLLLTLSESFDNQKPWLIFGPIGCGKSFVLVVQLARTAFAHVEAGKSGVAAVALCTTHEAAIQATRLLACLTWGTTVNFVCAVGGTSTNSLLAECKKKRPHILVGTPGKMADLFRILTPWKDASLLALDEGASLLSGSFVPQVKLIKEKLPKAHVQVYTSSFTPDHMKTFHGIFSVVPYMYKMGESQSQLMMMDEKWKTVLPRQLFNIREILVNIFEDIDLREPLIIFCPSRKIVDKVYKDIKALLQSLEKVNMDDRVFKIHAGLSQSEREHAIEGFSSQRGSKVLVATHVAAEAHNFGRLNQILHLGLPFIVDMYVQAIGRAARDGGVGRIRTAVTADKHVIYQDYAMWHMSDRKMEHDGVGLSLDGKEFTGGMGGMMITDELMELAMNLEHGLL